MKFEQNQFVKIAVQDENRLSYKSHLVVLSALKLEDVLVDIFYLYTQHMQNVVADIEYSYKVSGISLHWKCEFKLKIAFSK